MKPSFTQRTIKGIQFTFIYSYDSLFKEVLYQFKANYDYPLKDIFLEYYLDIFKKRYKKYKVVPIPSSFEDNQKRGFAHIEEIIKTFSNNMVVCLFKTDNFKQSDQNNQGRKEIGKHMILKEGLLSKKDKVLIVDDVYTTGNTISSAINLIKKTGVNHIKCLVLSKHGQNKQ
jgi:competence protein ComFC